MLNGRISKKQLASNLVRTENVLQSLKRLKDQKGTIKPAVKAVKIARQVLVAIESGAMPWPSVSVVSNGGIVLTWISLTRDILLTIDPNGFVQFSTSLKKIDLATAEIVDRIDAEGILADLIGIDHMMAWYCQDTTYHA